MGVAASGRTPYAIGAVRYAREIGALTPTVRIDVASDTAPEPDELLVVAFGNPTHARMGGYWGLGFGSIVDDD